MTSNAMHSLINAWAGMPKASPYMLPSDADALQSFTKSTVYHDSFTSYCSDPLFGLDDARLHLGLVPVPYLGNLAEADIFLLMLNPGLSPGDYFAEDHFPEYRDLLFQQLSQMAHPGFLFLDPKFAWHPGGQYWLARFRDLAISLIGPAGSFRDALRLLSEHVACLELVPYHSPRFGLSDRLIEKLASVQLIQRFVQEDLSPRAIAGEILIIVTRQVARWSLTPSQHVILYGNAHARGGHISSGSSGGAAIRRFLERKA